jgi:hypothetical protein
VSRLDRTIAVAVSATIWAGVVLVAAPGSAGTIAHIWLAAVLALALGYTLDRLRRAIPRRRTSAFDAAFAPSRRGRARPAALARVEREVTLATGTAFDVHFRLRPLVAPLATGLLLRRGVDPERRPEAARDLLGGDLWELVRPDRPAPDDRTAPGIRLSDVARVVDDLERLAWS